MARSLAMGIGGTLLGALVAVLERPSTWVFALVGFLVRGGWLIVLAPIVVLPTAVGIANVVAPLLEDIAFGRNTEDVVRSGGMALVVVLAWLVAGGLLAAATEIETVQRTVLSAELDGVPAPPRSGGTGRVFVARVVALLPLLAALAWAVFRFVGVGYREFTNPSDVALPVAARIAIGAPDAGLGIIAGWLFADIVGAIAARRIVLAGEGLRAALRGGVRALRARPGRSIAIATVSALVLVLVLAVTAIASGTAWDALRGALAEGDASIATSLILLLFVGLFTSGLVLVGLVSAWRSAVWTAEFLGGTGSGLDGTFGGGGGTRTGD